MDEHPGGARLLAGAGAPDDTGDADPALAAALAAYAADPAREPEVLAALHGELEAVADRDARYASALQQWRDAAAPEEAQARVFCERTALLLQAALLLRARSPMAEAFIRSRLHGEHGLAFGTLPAGLDVAAMLARALP